MGNEARIGILGLYTIVMFLPQKRKQLSPATVCYFVPVKNVRRMGEGVLEDYRSPELLN